MSCLGSDIKELRKEIKELEDTLRQGYKQIMEARNMASEANRGRLERMKRLVVLRELEKKMQEKE